MIPAMSYSLSAIRSAFKMIEASAHNTANMETDGFKKIDVVLNEGPGGGVSVDTVRVNKPGPSYLDPESGAPVEGSNADYPEEIARQMTAKHLLKYNAAVLKTGGEMQKSLLDIIA